ncbi:MAG: acyl carrier protein, partial [Bacteroidetes bacterium]
LSLPIYLPVEPGTSPAAVQARLLKALADQAELAPDPAERWAPLLPQGLLHATLRLALGQAQRRRRFPMSGFLSDNGFFSLRPLHAPGFRATDAVALPVYVPLAPFCLVALQHEGGTRLALQVPAGLDPAPLREGLAAAWAAGEAPACPSAGLVSDPLVGALRPFWARYLERPEADLAAGLSFVQLGGDSLQLLSLVAEVAPQFVPEQTTIFIEAVLNTGGRLSLADMAGMIHDVNASPP